jgi:membrane-associated PAP2 superfamily phosphatase
MNRVIAPFKTRSDPLGSRRAHVIAPLLAFVVFAIVFESTRIDVWLADAIYRWEGGTWTLRRDPLVRDLLHDAASRVVDVAYALLALACAASFFASRWRPYRWALLYLTTAVAVSALTVALLKDVTRVPCPWSLDRYGGNMPYLETWRAIVTRASSGRCFPSGHAGSGFAWIALYFVCRSHAPRWRWVVLVAVLLVGFVFGIAQQLRGAHFVSHDVWALAICWFVACAATPILRRESDGAGAAAAESS